MAKFCANLLVGACAAVADFSDGCLCSNGNPLVQLKNKFLQLGKFFCFAADDDTVSVEANPQAERSNNKFVSFAATDDPKNAEEFLQTNLIDPAAIDDLNNAEKVPQEDVEGASVGQNSEDDAGKNIGAVLNDVDNQNM